MPGASSTRRLRRCSSSSSSGGGTSRVSTVGYAARSTCTRLPPQRLLVPTAECLVAEAHRLLQRWNLLHPTFKCAHHVYDLLRCWRHMIVAAGDTHAFDSFSALLDEACVLRIGLQRDGKQQSLVVTIYAADEHAKQLRKRAPSAVYIVDDTTLQLTEEVANFLTSPALWIALTGVRKLCSAMLSKFCSSALEDPSHKVQANEATPGSVSVRAS